MNCFVIQNFNTQYPYILKSQRLRFLVFSYSRYLFYIFIKVYLITSNNLLTSNSLSSVWHYLYRHIFFNFLFKGKRRFCAKQITTVAVNLTRNYSYQFLKFMTHQFSPTPQIHYFHSPRPNKIYLKPVKLSLFPFQKKKLNSITLFLLYILHLNSYVFSSGFTLSYSFIFILPIFKFFNYNHFYYLKHRHL